MGEIRMLNLFRCGSAEEFEDVGEKSKVRENEAMVSYFVTDYFDHIKVEKQDENTATLSECMGIQTDANTKTGVSHQRFCLYSAEDVEYDIFQNETEYPVLMVIQLFINPDIYQASSFASGEELSRKELVRRLNRFIAEKTVASEVKWRIYQLLTVGDFAVIIRSKKVHAAYDICTMIRSLRMSVKGEEQLPEVNEAVFFSYSICGIVNGKDREETGKWREYLEPQDQVIVRIKYTHSFRQKLEKSTELKQELLANGAHLIGRYDHQISLTPEEFETIYPLLKKYKLEGEKIQPDMLESNNISIKTNILIKMMAGGFISHINEQLLLHYERDVYLEEEQDEAWRLLCNGGIKWTSLYEKNNEQIMAIGKKAEELAGRMESYYQSSRNLKEYLRLLGRIHRVFHEINKQKELRISVSNALTQYETLIDSFLDYVNQIPLGEEKFYADIIEENLQYGMRALEIFTRYIRNVNLQSFQTPNYDLQTNMSIEKIMLAYSQFLKPYVLEEEKERPYKTSADFQPLIVPSMGVKDLSVAVVFGNDILFDELKNKRKLMVVYSPTLSFLCETCFQLSAVFHEIAHQFRYEDRGERNLCLEKSIFKKFTQLLVLNIIDKNKVYDLAENTFVANLVETVYKNVFSSLIPGENQKECLARFTQGLCAELTGFCRYASESDRTLRTEVELYLSKTKKGVQEYDAKVVEIFGKIEDSLEKTEIEKKESAEDGEKEKFSYRLQNLEKAVQKLKICQENQIFDSLIKELRNISNDTDAGCCEIIGDFEKLWAEMSDGHDNSEQIGKAIFDRWEEWEGTHSGNGGDTRQIMHLLKQYHNVNAAYRCFRQYTEKYPRTEEKYIQRVRYQRLFEALCECLQEELSKGLNELLKNRDRELKWSMLAIPSEYLDSFMKELRLKGKKGMADMLKGKFQLHAEAGLCAFIDQDVSIYREATSDLFMCAAMELDFFGYLVVAAEMLKFDERNKAAQMDRVSYVLQCLYAEASGAKNDAAITITTEDFHNGIKKRMEEETNLLLYGIHKVAEKTKEAKTVLKKWPKEHEFENLKDISNFLGDCVSVEMLNSTQKWIIRVYRQVVAIVYNQSLYEVNANIIGRKDIWEDITSKNAYSFNEKVRDVLKKNRDSKIYDSITEILNSPAKFFVKRKTILCEEFDFILDQYERNCKSIFRS